MISAGLDKPLAREARVRQKNSLSELRPLPLGNALPGVCIKGKKQKARPKGGKPKGMLESEERRWVLFETPRCDIHGVGEGKWP